MDIKIIFEDKDILVVEKPAGIAAQSDKTEDLDLTALLGREQLFVIQRLDRPVGGVMVYGKTPLAASGLSRQIAEKSMRKEYLAIVCGAPEEPEGELVDWLKKLRTINMSKAVEPKTPGSKEARLNYKVMGIVESEEFGSLTLLKVQLFTGRHHQIRVQLANIGCPIKGDLKYGFGRSNKISSISLHARELSFEHPTLKQKMKFIAPVPQEPLWQWFEENVK